MSSTSQLIINVCLTGVVPRKQLTPHVPVREAEIIADGIAVLDAGASMLHVHVRDEHEDTCYRRERFATIFEGIRRKHPQAILIATTTGRRHPEFEHRSDVLELEGVHKPDMASLTLSSLNFMQAASINEPDMVSRLAARMNERGIVPELEAFDPGMVNAAIVMRKRGLLQPPFYINLLFGSIYSSQASMRDITYLSDLVPDDFTIGMAGLGGAQLRVNAAAIAMGHHVRVGLEDNIWYDQARTKQATNLELVQRVVELAKMFERPVATAAAARELLGLAPRTDTIGGGES